jgi:CRISPR-associated endonuclease/helicase Cas3
MQITTLPVYSRLADPAEVQATFSRALPVSLSQHQLETYKALNDPNIDVVINTAMTGDGKSLAGQLPLLVNWSEVPTLALYPTNELIQDQHRSIEDLFPKWGRSPDRAAMIYGAQLDDLEAAAETLKRPDVLQRELKNRKMLLSNPDIFHAILQFQYQQFGRAATTLVKDLSLNFQQLTFDEFHIFDTAQITAVLTGLLFLHEQNSTLKTLFLSATPDQRLIEPLQRVGFGERLKIINPQQQGWYREEPGDDWRPILQGSQITLVQQNAEEWIAHGLEEVLIPWFRQRPAGAKAAIIVNSVATALRLEQLLRPRLAELGLRVEPNTRLNGRSTRKASYEADVLIGTSTVDVGVDFRINLLIFEASNARIFMQRLGRLGRHTHYQDRNGTWCKFQDFAAYALVPPFVYDRLTEPKEGQSPRLRDGDKLPRQQFGEHINAVYPEPAHFRFYASRWGRFQPAKVYFTLMGRRMGSDHIDRNVRESFAATREGLKQAYYKLAYASMKQAIDEWQSYCASNEGLLVQEAQSFRGGSPFECGVLKEGEDDPLTYNLFWLLENTNLEMLDQEMFCRMVERMQRSTTPFKRGRMVAFFRWHGLRPQAERLTVLLNKQVSGWGSEKHHTAQVLPGIRLMVNGHNEFLTDLNDSLARHPVVGLLVPGYDPQQLRSEVYLPGLFALHRYQDMNGLSGCIAFGRQALLLDSVPKIHQLRNTGNDPLFG